MSGPALRGLSLTTVLFLIVVIEALALGLKAFDDRQKSTSAKQVETHREALAVSEYVSGKIASVEQVLRLGYQAGWSPRQIASAHADLTRVTSLTDALTANEGTLLRTEGEFASKLLASGETAGLTDGGDLIVAFDPEPGTPRFGIVPSKSWLPDAQPPRSFSIVPVRTDGAQKTALDAIQACSPLSAGNMSVCVETARPVFGRQDAIGLGIYGLLLLGPVLTILGLFKLLEQRGSESEAFEGQATRAGRILETVLHEAKAGFWSWDAGTQQVWISAEAGHLLGEMPEGSYTLTDFLAFVYEDHRSAVEQALTTLSERGFVTQAYANSDKTAWLDMRAKQDETNGEINGILRDITDMKTAVARTKQAENRLKSALEGFSGPFALWDSRRRLIYWNHAFVRVCDLESTVRAGMGYDTVMLSQAANIIERRPGTQEDNAEIIRVRPGHWFKMIERTTNTGGMITMGMDVSADVKNEVALTKQQGRLRKLVAELERSEGHAAELARKLHEEKLRAEKSANSKSTFLANMSHELRTPLNAINGFSEILIEEMYGPLGSEKYKGYAQDILTSGQHLLDMINDILDMAKIEAGKMTVDLRSIDIVDPVDAAIRMVRRKAEEKDIDLKLVANPDLPRLEADHRAVRQMILNLVSNAIKFTDIEGEIRVTIDQKEDEVRIAVRDNGVGIPADALPRIGQPFEQVSDTRDRNYEGTGLGLALTKSFAEMHGGRLVIASQEGRGTQVSIFMPVPKSEETSASNAA